MGKVSKTPDDGHNVDWNMLGLILWILERSKHN